jgi:hypothetical protein
VELDDWRARDGNDASVDIATDADQRDFVNSKSGSNLPVGSSFEYELGGPRGLAQVPYQQFFGN